MNTNAKLLLIAGLSAIVAAPAAQSPDLQPMVVSHVTGELRVQQELPGTCDNVDQVTPVTLGRLEMSPSQGTDVPGGKRFTLTRASISFAPFSIHRDCMTQNVTRSYTEVGVQLVKSVSFTAPASAPGVYDVSIPKDDLILSEAAIVNGDPETGFTHPGETVTGTIDLTHGTVQMRVVIATQLHFAIGCVPVVGCLFEGNKPGALTATLSGDIVAPDADHDGIPDGRDNCRFVANADQSPVPTPTISAPSASIIASCADHQIGTPTAADVCDRGPLTITNDAPGTFAVGANLVTWTAHDAKSRTSSATQTVTVVDTTPPIFTVIPPDITMNNCGAATLGVPAATDDCAGAVTFTNNAPASFGVGTTPVTWTAHDASGNTAIATQMVTVHDTVPPTVSCVPDGPPGGTFRVTGIDACGASTLRLGSYVLANGERIKINETGKSGVTLINDVGPDHIRHFHVGKGEAVITATDGSGNLASAMCR